jgi:hypothetical protein
MDGKQVLGGGPITGETRGETAELLILIEPDIHAARRRLFGTDRAPFKSWGRTRAWIAAESGRQTTIGMARAWRVYQRAIRACATLAKLTGRECVIESSEAPVLLYQHARQQPRTGRFRDKSVRFAPGSKLAQLKQVVAAIAEASGFDERQVLAHLLVGQRPFLSPWRATIRVRTLPSGPARPSIEFELNVQDVPWKELREVYRNLRRVVQRLHVPLSLTAREARLMSAVQTFGGKPPRSGAGAAWQSISRRAEYPNGQAARVAYGRIQKKRNKHRRS